MGRTRKTPPGGVAGALIDDLIDQRKVLGRAQARTAELMVTFADARTVLDTARINGLRAGGVDPRYQGWGGEDLSFGWVLAVTVGRQQRLGAELIHLWHPHPAPDLRGSLESEELVARYQGAYKHFRRTKDDGPMRLLVEEVKRATCRT